MPKLKLSVGSPTVGQDGIAGYQRYRIDFQDMDLDEKYILGWISPRYPESEIHEALERIKGWWTGWNREVWQEDVYNIQPFIVKLYRVGPGTQELWLIDEQHYEDLQPA